jgi:hypothetical protein
MHAAKASVDLRHPHGDPWWRLSNNRVLRQVGHIATCVTPDLLLKYPDTTLATYVRRQVKHLRHMSETLTKTLISTLRQCNIQINTLAKYV